MEPAYPMNWEGAVIWLRSQPDMQEIARACYYDDPVAEAARRFHSSGEWQATRRFFPLQPGRALDLGAGRGIASYALAADGWRVTALEPDPSEVVGTGAIRRIVSATTVDIDVVASTAESIPLPDACIDLVYARQALHHSRDLKRFCSEVSRVLRPGGTFIATREHVISRPEDLAEFQRRHPLHFLYGGESAYTLAQYRGAIASSGIVLTEVLNPIESEINLFPQTRQGVRALIAQRVRLPIGNLIPDFVLNRLGDFLNDPGRLYSFVGRKHPGR